jgi:hypothetical protein
MTGLIAVTVKPILEKTILKKSCTKYIPDEYFKTK